MTVSLHLSTIKRLTVYHKPLTMHGFHRCCRGGCSLAKRVARLRYLAVAGAGEIELDGERQMVRPGDAILIPPGAWNTMHDSTAACHAEAQTKWRAALCARGYVFRITGRSTVSANSPKKDKS
jgi:hypothetical protein